MSNAAAPSSAIGLISAMITPALLIVGSASLVASALVRMARVVDRARALAAVAHEGSWGRMGVTPAVLRAWLDRHAARARYAQRAIELLYTSVVAWVATCLSIALYRAVGESLAWLPISLALFGTLLLLAGGAFMIAESRLSGHQIREEIREAQSSLEEPGR